MKQFSQNQFRYHESYRNNKFPHLVLRAQEFNPNCWRTYIHNAPPNTTPVKSERKLRIELPRWRPAWLRWSYFYPVIYAKLAPMYPVIPLVYLSILNVVHPATQYEIALAKTLYNEGVRTYQSYQLTQYAFVQ